MLALVVALGAPALAAGKVTGQRIKDGSVTGQDIRNGSLSGVEIRNRSIRGLDLAPGTTIDHVRRTRMLATNGVSADAARLAAPRVVLFRRGAVTIYGKCFNDTSTDVTYYTTYAASTRRGTILDSRNDELHGGAAADFLGPATDEGDAGLEYADAVADSATAEAEDDSDFAIFAADGTTLRGWTAGAVKNGNLPGGNGVYGAGVCLVTSLVQSD